MSIIISGSNGFIGSSLLSKMKERGINNLIPLGKSLGDISEINTFDNLPASKFFIHLANKTFIPDSWNYLNKFINTNILGTSNVLEYCKIHNSHLIFISSYLYGNQKKLPTNEKAKIDINNPYVLTKKTSEDLCKLFNKKYGIKITILRPFNVYGPKQKNNFLIPSIINQIINKKNILVNDLKPERDYIYVDDLVDSIIKCLDIKNNFEIINIGSGKTYSVKKIIDIIQSIMGTKISIKCKENIRYNETMKTQADIEKANKILNWQPKHSLRDGLIKCINFYKM